ARWRRSPRATRRGMATPESSSGLSDGGGRDRDLFPATRRTRVNRHDRGADQADRMFRQWPYHLLASFAANEPGIPDFISHGESLRQSLKQFTEGVKPALERSSLCLGALAVGSRQRLRA